MTGFPADLIGNRPMFTCLRIDQDKKCRPTKTGVDFGIQ